MTVPSPLHNQTNLKMSQTISSSTKFNDPNLARTLSRTNLDFSPAQLKIKQYQRNDPEYLTPSTSCPHLHRASPRGPGVPVNLGSYSPYKPVVRSELDTESGQKKYYVRDNLRRAQMYLIQRARGSSINNSLNDIRNKLWDLDHEECVNAERDMSDSLLAKLQLKPRDPGDPFKSLLYYVTESTIGKCNHPHQLEVEVGDLVVREFTDGSDFTRFTYEDEEYKSHKPKFPHISEDSFRNFLQGRYPCYWVRKIGGKGRKQMLEYNKNEKYSNAKKNLNFDKDSSSTNDRPMRDIDEGYVPVRFLEEYISPVSGKMFGRSRKPLNSTTSSANNNLNNLNYGKARDFMLLGEVSGLPGIKEVHNDCQQRFAAENRIMRQQMLLNGNNTSSSTVLPNSNSMSNLNSNSQSIIPLGNTGPGLGLNYISPSDGTIKPINKSSLNRSSRDTVAGNNFGVQKKVTVGL